LDEFARVEEVDHPAAIKGISGHAVGVPGENSIGVAAFDSIKHMIKDGAAGPLGTSLLNENLTIWILQLWASWRISASWSSMERIWRSGSSVDFLVYKKNLAGDVCTSGP